MNIHLEFGNDDDDDDMYNYSDFPDKTSNG